MLQVGATGIEEEEEEDSIFVKACIQFLKLATLISLYFPGFIIFFFNLNSGGWNQGPLDTAAT
jgi:hypothetical protein